MGGYPTEHVTKNWTESLFGHELKSPKSWSLFFTRLMLGFMFLWGGYEKILTEMSGKMATKGFLAYATTGPFVDFFHGLAGNWAVEYLVVYGELAIGISLMFGLFTRIGGISGILMSGLFYVALLPVENNPFVDEYVIFIGAFLVLTTFAAGRFLGVDGILVNFTREGSKLNRIFRALG